MILAEPSTKSLKAAEGEENQSAPLVRAPQFLQIPGGTRCTSPPQNWVNRNRS